MPMPPLLAILVGGKSRRMGTPKGLLPVAPEGAPIIEAQVREAHRAGLDVVLVGDATPYAELLPGIPRVDDDPPGIGPLGGLRAALLHASGRGHAAVICLACDMPRVSQRVLERIARPSDTNHAAVVAPRRDPGAPWEPMLARYEVHRVQRVLDAALADGVRSFQAFFARVDVATLPVDAALEEALTDWDKPDDVPT